jgi:hypothetical protein
MNIRTLTIFTVLWGFLLFTAPFSTQAQTKPSEFHEVIATPAF